MKKILAYLAVVAVLLAPLVQACAPANKTSQNPTQNDRSQNVISTNKYKLSLAEYLQRVPGVLVRGERENAIVTVRGVSSLRSDNQPLFVLNGQLLGNSFYEVSRLIDMNDVQEIEVLNSLEGSSMFGLRGGNGAILITTKN